MFREDTRPRAERITAAIGIVAVAVVSVAIPFLLTLHKTTN
jgi:hypothetical protein